MKHLKIITLFFLIFISCKEFTKRSGNLKEEAYQIVTDPGYELNRPINRPNAVLVLFGGYPEVVEDIKREFKILEPAKKNDIAVIFSNYSRKLWFEENEIKKLAEQLESIFTNNKLPKENIYFGGFSSGGDIALLIGDYLTEKNSFKIAPKGIFIVDSPIDLSALYFSSEKNIKRNFSAVSVQESSWLIEHLGSRFGDPNKDLTKYEEHAVFTLATGNIDNIKNLKNTRIRMYTEPDTLWWKKNRMADYEQTNAFYIKKLSEKLKEKGFSKVKYMPTKNRGYRSNGERHPHSWSIVKTDDLLEWMLESK